jgi:hypothetical protein
MVVPIFGVGKALHGSSASKQTKQNQDATIEKGEMAATVKNPV